MYVETLLTDLKPNVLLPNSHDQGLLLMNQI